MFPLFPLGQIVATSGALAALERAKQPLPVSWPVMQSGSGANWSQPMSQRMSTAWLIGFD
jgi:hypothetical protein